MTILGDTVVDEQRDTIMNAMRIVQDQTGIELPGQQLEYLCMEWSLHHNNDPEFVSKMQGILTTIKK